ncbi:myosin-light-chain kinase [Besnoitia besnoiti]|uniref:Myosin-light-chain kinase n=1 Tax=Besnoitia besnoiti TaxID=94643 RepID=A0A2A9MKX9_BESBE|nr:myosin-light-chain kinase [Besnoitia besnoiti]PFH38665.1 myosin-light-chain kinase [Besnoitia besnoiti]
MSAPDACVPYGDMSNRGETVDYAGKFFYGWVDAELLDGASSESEVMDEEIKRQKSCHRLLLERAPVSDLLAHGIAVLLMPLLGPALAQFRPLKVVDAALACLMYSLVRTASYLKQLGTVHRDVTLDNIAVDESGQPSLVDFGFATRRGVLSLCSRWITSEYISPERVWCIVSGETHLVVSETLDSWALGITLFRLICHPHGPIPYDVVEDLDPAVDKYSHRLLRALK